MCSGGGGGAGGRGARPGLVVKTGSKALASTSSLMPGPLSATQTITYSPAGGSSARSGAPRETLAVSTVTVPPTSMASRALMARFRMTSSIWVGSIIAGQR